MPDTYRKRPLTAEAKQWTGDNITELWDWIGADTLYGPLPVGDELRPEGQPARLYVAANDAWLNLDVGEWIIRDSLGFYPCKDEVFRATYEKSTVPDQTTEPEAFIPLDHPARLRACRAERDKAYRDRAEILAVLAASMPAQLVRDADPTAPGWPVLFIDTPAGQLSWHISPADADLFPTGIVRESSDADAMSWDGHDDREKSSRLASFARVLHIAKATRA